MRFVIRIMFTCSICYIVFFLGYLLYSCRAVTDTNMVYSLSYWFMTKWFLTYPFLVATILASWITFFTGENYE